MPEALPSEYQPTAFVVGQVKRVHGDTSADPDNEVEADPVTGIEMVTFTAASKHRVVLSTSPASYVLQDTVTADLDAFGILGISGQQGVSLWPDVWTVTPGPNWPSDFKFDPFKIEVKSGHTEEHPFQLWSEAPFVPPPGATVNLIEFPSGGTDGDALALNGATLVWKKPSITASASSLPAGSEPTAEMSGSWPNLTLGIGIPAGEDGAPGVIHVFPEGTDTSALPVGTVFGLYPAATSAPEIRGWAGGNIGGASQIIADPTTGTGEAPQAGDTMILITANDITGTTPAPGAWTLPPGWTSLAAIPQAGTMAPGIMTGTATGADTLTFTNTVTAMAASWCLIWLSGAASPSSVTIGPTKARQASPAETTTITCPPITVTGACLVLAIACERTSANEATTPTWAGSAPACWVPQDAAAGTITTVSVATQQTTDAATQTATCTYPNPQSNNGIGWQIGIPGVA